MASAARSYGVSIEWSYYVDFENRRLETWKRATEIEEMCFEDLTEKYMEELEERNEASYNAEGSEDSEDSADTESTESSGRTASASRLT